MPKRFSQVACRYLSVLPLLHELIKLYSDKEGESFRCQPVQGDAQVSNFKGIVLASLQSVKSVLLVVVGGPAGHNPKHPKNPAENKQAGAGEPCGKLVNGFRRLHLSPPDFGFHVDDSLCQSNRGVFHAARKDVCRGFLEGQNTFQKDSRVPNKFVAAVLQLPQLGNRLRKFVQVPVGCLLRFLDGVCLRLFHEPGNVSGLQQICCGRAGCFRVLRFKYRRRKVYRSMVPFLVLEVNRIGSILFVVPNDFSVIVPVLCPDNRTGGIHRVGSRIGRRFCFRLLLHPRVLLRRYVVRL